MKIKAIASEEGVMKDNLMLRCQDCLHYRGTVNPIYDTVCKNRGILPSAAAPNCYTPDISVFRPLGINFYQTLATLLSNLPPSSTRVLAGVLKTSPKLKGKGLSLFQKVYFSIGNAKYLSNWFSGFIVAPGMLPSLVLVAGSLKRSTNVVTAILDLDSLATREKFIELREEMIRKGCLVDPENLRTKFKPSSTKAAEYEPPTIDKINEDSLAKERIATRNSKVKKGQVKKGEPVLKVTTKKKKLAPAGAGFPNRKKTKDTVIRI